MVLELRILESGDEPFVDWFDPKNNLDLHEKDSLSNLPDFKRNL
jgi:hypothetical protein